MMTRFPMAVKAKATGFTQRRTTCAPPAPPDRRGAEITGTRHGGAAALDLLRLLAHHPAMLIYKIFRRSEWDQLVSAGETTGAPIDVADGYIHFSTSAQVAETAAKHFADEDGLWLLALDADRLGDDLHWEPSRGGQLFPHLYRMLRLNDVTWARPYPLSDSGHVLPEGVQ